MILWYNQILLININKNKKGLSKTVDFSLKNGASKWLDFSESLIQSHFREFFELGVKSEQSNWTVDLTPNFFGFAPPFPRVGTTNSN